MERINKKIETFINNFFSDVDFEFQGGTKAKPESEVLGLKYEYFINSFEVFKYKKEIDVEDIKRLSTGHLKGIDSVYLVLNGKFFAIPEINDVDFEEFIADIDYRVKNDDEIKATFHFTQIKSEETNQDKFSGFCDAVYDVFNSEDSDILNNKRIMALKAAFERIAEKTEDINLFLKFCAVKKDTKKLNELEKTWNSTIQKKNKELKSTKFKKVDIQLLSGQDYFSKLDSYNSPNKRKFEINQINTRFIKYEIDETVTHLGFFSLKDIIKLLTDDEGNFDDVNVFFDNIRYFQGDTSVNSKILKSLNINGVLFHTLHNGIIITSNESRYNAANGNLIIEGFSIVNGCQTCNMIWKWYENSLDKETNVYRITDEQLEQSKIPVKIVITPNFDLRNKITEAANTQNPIKTINLIAISDTAKMLESKFKELEWLKRKEKLIFQRLPKYGEEGDNYLNVSLEDTARSFYSTFGQVPHEVSRSFGKFLDKKLEAEDFLSDKKGNEYDISSYLISSIVLNYLIRFLKSRYGKLTSLKHHLLLLFFYSIDSNFLSNTGKKNSKELVEKIINVVDDKEEFEKTCSTICDFAINKLTFYIDNSIEGKPKVIPKSYYSEEHTKKMIELFGEYLKNA